jgi:hypothetical protein
VDFTCSFYGQEKCYTLIGLFCIRCKIFSSILFPLSLVWLLGNLTPRSVEHLKIFFLRITGCVGTGTGIKLRCQKLVVSRDSDEPYVFHSFATSLHIPHSSILHRTTQFGVWPATALSKTLSTDITFCCSVARQAESNIPAR